MGLRSNHLCIAIWLTAFCGSFGFETQYLGNYLSDEEYNKQEFCSTKICMLDADRLIYAADHNSNKTDPCNDFVKFSMGEFVKHRVPHERYIYIGFLADARQQYREKQKRVLNKPVQPDEPKVIKIAKSFYRKCVNSTYVQSNGVTEVKAALLNLGVPLVSKAASSEKEFDVEALFNFGHDLAMYLFFDQTLTRCYEENILCFQTFRAWSFTEHFANDMLRIMENLDVDEYIKEEIVNDTVDFLKLKMPIQKTLWMNGTPETLKIKELSERFPLLKIDWLKFINSLQLSTEQKTGEDEILIQNPQMWAAHLETFAKLDNKTIANAFTAAYLYINKFIFIAYSFTKGEQLKYGSRRSAQRFEQCVRFMEDNMKPALLAFMGKSFYNEKIQRSATELVREAVEDSIKELNRTKLIDNDNFKVDVIRKLETAKVIVMFPDEVLDIKLIEDLYNDLEFQGHEGLLDMSQRINTMKKKLSLQPESYLKKVLSIKDVNIDYIFDDNILNVPVMFTLYPVFHPNRARFFNTATLYTSAVEAINREVTIIYEKKFNETLDSNFILIDNEILADENFQNFEANGGKDLNMTSFKLTKRQMLWLCTMNFYTIKPGLDVKKKDAISLQNEYKHVLVKSLKPFREAFHCGELTSEEKARLTEYEEENRKLEKIKLH